MYILKYTATKERKMHAPEVNDRYVSYEPENESVFVRLIDGKIDLSVYICNELEVDDKLDDAIVAWAEGTDPVIIAPHFKVSSPVDYLIEGNTNHGSGLIDFDAKVVFDALRAELQEQIDRIDELKYEPWKPKAQNESAGQYPAIPRQNW